MSRNIFVFGIGGTGSRVVRALTMLLASGTKLNDTNKIIPIIIDVDADNADTSRTLKALESYRYIRKNGYGNTESANGFFNTDLNTLSSLGVREETADAVDDSFQLEFENMDKSFLDYLDPKGELVGDINMDLLEALYDNTPQGHKNFDHTELNLRLNVGFKGNPNIGSVVFNNLSNTKGFKFILRSIGEDDRIFIISSIFGGTGSAGFPQLLKLLQEEEKLRKNKYGALTIMPYFNVTDDANSAINSELFNSKTEAALTYYQKYLKGRVNSFYQLWDSPMKQYDNKQGGQEQKNPAHIVEMIGATAIIDFANRPNGEIPLMSSTSYYDFGIKKNEDVIDLRHFFKTTSDKIMVPLTLFTYAMKLYTESIPNLSTESFYIDLDLKSRFESDEFYQHFRSFFNTHYRNWLSEMADNERRFQPFNLNSDLNGLVREKPIEVKKILGVTRDGGISDKFLIKQFGKINEDLNKTITNPKHRFMKLLNRMSDECYAKLEGLPTII